MCDDFIPVAHSHVYWPRDSGFPAQDDEVDGIPMHDRIHRMASKGGHGHSSHWEPRFPNDEFVDDEAVTLEEMRAKGAV